MIQERRKKTEEEENTLDSPFTPYSNHNQVCWKQIDKYVIDIEAESRIPTFLSDPVYLSEIAVSIVVSNPLVYHYKVY